MPFQKPTDIVHGDYFNDEFFLVNNEYDGLIIVHSDYYHQESAIIFTVGHHNTDWSEDMLLEQAKRTVDLLNKK